MDWDWITQNLRGEMAAPWLQIVIVLAAVVCGGIVGSERERHDKPAGLRTLTLVCLGSAIFTMASFFFTTTTGDSGRVAAQIVTGIGFLGAGAIMHARGSVTGMTTAATVWVMAAIGITVGGGYPIAGVGLSLLTRLVLAGVLKWELHRWGGLQSRIVEITFDPEGGKTRIRMERLCEEFRVPGALGPSTEATPEGEQAYLRVTLPRKFLLDLLDGIASLPAVRGIRDR
jgi:putative Mg2+ transporter-C (MgtC) family protein